MRTITNNNASKSCMFQYRSRRKKKKINRGSGNTNPTAVKLASTVHLNSASASTTANSTTPVTNAAFDSKNDVVESHHPCLLSSSSSPNSSDLDARTHPDSTTAQVSSSDPFCFTSHLNNNDNNANYKNGGSFLKRTKNRRKKLDIDRTFFKADTNQQDESLKHLPIILRTNNIKMLHHPLFLLQERELGKSRDKRRQSSASIPPFLLLDHKNNKPNKNLHQSPFCSRILQISRCIKDSKTNSDVFDLYNEDDPNETSFQQQQQQHKHADISFSNELQPSWKPSMLRSIPFSELDTCFSQAILALDRTGSFMISLGPPPSFSSSSSSTSRSSIINALTSHKKMHLYIPTLSLSFFSVPSPATLEKRKLDNSDLLSWFMSSTTSSSSSTLTNPNNVLNHDITLPKKKTEISPLILTIPLRMNRSESSRYGVNDGIHILSNRDAMSSSNISSPETLPVQILTSQDSVVVVIYLYHSLPVRQEPDADPPIGTVVIAPMPACISSNNLMEFITSYRCPNVPMRGCRTTPTIQNLLWPTHFIPTICKQKSQQINKCKDNHDEIGIQNADIKNGKGYILFHDEEDGYRITWIHRKYPPLNETQSCQRQGSNQTRFSLSPKWQNVVTIPNDLSWEAFRSHSTTSLAVPCGITESQGDISIAFESYLHVDALLDDILKRRTRTSCRVVQEMNENINATATATATDHGFFLPDFYYNLISVADQGRTVHLVIVFDNTKGIIQSANPSATSRAASIGVFLRLDLLDQSYDEMEWVQHPSQSSTGFLRRWSNILAVHHRMKEEGIETCNYSMGITLNMDVNSQENINYLQPSQKRKKTIRGYGKETPDVTKGIDVSSLYPFCNATGNQAVLSETPVSKIVCLEAPIELKYG